MVLEAAGTDLRWGGDRRVKRRGEGSQSRSQDEAELGGGTHLAALVLHGSMRERRLHGGRHPLCPRIASHLSSPLLSLLTPRAGGRGGGAEAPPARCCALRFSRRAAASVVGRSAGSPDARMPWKDGDCNVKGLGEERRGLGRRRGRGGSHGGRRVEHQRGRGEDVAGGADS